ncbi:MAG: hypothetical protein ABUT20_10210 [Bacteroidota bacterium]
MNNKSLAIITQRIRDIQYGLLRFHHNKNHMAYPVKITANEESILNCIIENDPDSKKFLNKEVSLIQKYNDDYVYVSGTVCEEIQKTKRILFVQIVKASWFVRQSNGNTSWLRQKLQYDNREEIKSQISA